MIRDFFHSTVFKIAALMFSISLLAVVSMFSSVFISDSAQTDALAINVAGSLRMQSFKIVTHLQHVQNEKNATSPEHVKTLIDKFESNLTTGILANQLTTTNTDKLATLHNRVEELWFKQIKPQYILALSQKIDEESLIQQTSHFVATIDTLVSSYQQHAENNIAKIRLIQSLALFFTVILIAFAMFIVNRHIEQPLSKLTAVARQIGRGNFTAQADEEGKGELAILAKTINKMSHSIYRSQSQLEETVKKKTIKLQNSNESLELLFELSRKLHEMDPSKHNFKPILQRLANVTGVKDLDLCIMTAGGNAPYEHLITTDKDFPEKCLQHDCSDCTEHNKLFSQTDMEALKYPLTQSETNYGVLVVHPNNNFRLEDWQYQLFESVAEQIATGLSIKHQHEQSRRIALMNERTVIARELHDSLAQALSYLKIQVTRLQKLHQKDSAQEQIDQVIDELKGGLSSAYRELRELLTTFRLKIDGQSLKTAFDQSIEQLKSRSDAFEFTLNYNVGHVPFSPQEEIHLLQIAREATQNAFYHSKGNRINISLTMDEFSTVTLSIKDNGIGIPGDPNKLNHYGLAIMQERSCNLDGDLSITKSEEGGTAVVFKFRPEYAKESVAVVKSA